MIYPIVDYSTMGYIYFFTFRDINYDPEINNMKRYYIILIFIFIIQDIKLHGMFNYRKLRY